MGVERGDRPVDAVGQPVDLVAAQDASDVDGAVAQDPLAQPLRGQLLDRDDGKSLVRVGFVGRGRRPRRRDGIVGHVRERGVAELHEPPFDRRIALASVGGGQRVDFGKQIRGHEQPEASERQTR